ncbi:hypothetical protein BDY19DRAFT_887453 [Irpex rosettiformis]|uniref:Uncharacterized protein n=1 Tax=Irpex rosettiformis TaxID=378272 RepID=A0ACB8U8T4_9APHY|nr:hypothetical protein BDY19DRAFT_887453 [Irpex rosettiformis]
MVQKLCSTLLASSICLLLTFTGVVQASPFLTTDLSRRGPVITYDDSGHIVNVTDPNTGTEIIQGNGTDGGGTDFDACAIVWLVFSFAVGVPLLLTGLRFWRLTTGYGVGLSVLVCIWAAFVNSSNPDGVSDTLITIIVLVAFGLGFFLGMFKVGRAAGMAALTWLGGMSIGARIVLFREDLLVHSFAVNWGIITVIGAISFIVVLFSTRVAMTLSSASVGTFLTGLGIDLIIKKQAGMSMGLRYLFDRNSSHYFSTRGWHPPLVTIIIMAASLGLIPIFAVAQHYMFKQAFYPGRKDYILSSRMSSESEPQEIPDDETVRGTSVSEKEKKGTMSETSSSSSSVPRVLISSASTSVADDHRPASPVTPAKEKDSFIGHAV